MSSLQDEELLLLLLALRNTPKKKKRRCWVHQINTKREELGEYHRLCIELESHEDRFFKYFRMSQECFEELHNRIKGKIEKCSTNWRKPVEPRERLAVCLRYLATGDTRQTIASSFRMGRSTVSSIVKEVSREIWNVLYPTYLPKPTVDMWEKSEEGFAALWGFPNCIGSVDGKHIKLKCPSSSGSQFVCYKTFFSLTLLAVVDPYYKFMVVDIGSYGRHSDAAIFENSHFYREYIDGKNILPPKPLPGTDTPVPHVFVADEGFSLQTYMMRPYPKVGVINNARKQMFNAQLSRARRVVDNAFDTLAMNWRVFSRPVEGDIETAESIVKAACCLHNYIISKNDNRECTAEEECGPIGAFVESGFTNRRSPNAALQVRECFADYFESRNNAT